MHLEDTAETFSCALGGVVRGLTGLDHTGVYAEEAELSDVRVGHDLERESREWFLVGGMTNLFFLGHGIDTLDRGNIGRRGHIVHDCVEELLYALVLVRGTADHGYELIGDGGATDSSLYVIGGKFLTLDVLLEKFLIGFREGFEHSSMILFRLAAHILRNGFYAHILAEFIVVNIGFHVDQVNDPTEGFLSPDGKLNRNSVGFETFLHHIYDMVEVCAHDVHFVDVRHTGNAVFSGLSPNGFRLRFNAALCAEYGYRAIEHAEGTLNFNGEVDVTGGVDDIDARILPEARGRRGGNGDTSFLFLFHPVHGRGALVGFADLMGLSGVEQNAFRSGRLTGINVCHDTDVPGTLK